MSDNEVKDYAPNKAVVNATVQWPDLRLSEQIKHLRFFRDKDNNIVAMPVVMFDPTQVGLNVLPMGRVGISDPAAVNSYARVFGLPCCGWPETTLGLVTHSTQMLQKGAMLEAQRTPTIWRTLSAAVNAGATIIWNPPADRRFRLMGGILSLSKDAACAGAEYIGLRDDVTDFFHIDISSGALVATGNVIVIPFAFPQNGFLSAAINNNLNLTLGGALTAGYASAQVWGTEEV